MYKPKISTFWPFCIFFYRLRHAKCTKFCAYKKENIRLSVRIRFILLALIHNTQNKNIPRVEYFPYKNIPTCEKHLARTYLA